MLNALTKWVRSAPLAKWCLWGGVCSARTWSATYPGFHPDFPLPQIKSAKQLLGAMGFRCVNATNVQNHALVPPWGRINNMQLSCW